MWKWMSLASFALFAAGCFVGYRARQWMALAVEGGGDGNKPIPPA